MIAKRPSFRLESGAGRLACAALVFVASLATYSLTIAPTVTLVDSGELIVAARTLGIAHPPGFPLYVLLAHLATLLPLGSIATRVNFASGFFAALASATLTLAAAELLLTARLIPTRIGAGKPKRERHAKKSGSPSRPQSSEAGADVAASRIALMACVVSGLLLGFSRTLWAYATIAEVYTLNTLVIVAIFLLMFHWRRLRLTDTAKLSAPDVITKHDRWLTAAAVLFGVGLGAHHVSVALTLPALAWLVLATEGIRFFWTQRLLRAALFAFGGLLSVYAYLPLAASRSPVINWGDPHTLERFWWHITGRQYHVFFSFSAEQMGDHVGEFFTLVARQYGPWFLAIGLLFAAVGVVALVKRDTATFWFLALVATCDVIYSSGYGIAEDKDAYYLPAFVALAISTAFVAEFVRGRELRFGRLPANVSVAIVSALLLLAPALALFGNLPFNNRSRYFIAGDYVENILKTVEPGGMVLTADWQVYSPMFYMQQIEHQRSDVISMDIKQLRRSWYYEYLASAYPQTIEQARDEVDAFLEDLRAWEHDPELYNRDLMLNQRIGARFYEMILAFMSDHIQAGPVYLTRDVATGMIGNAVDPEDADLRKALSKSYQLVPKGLVFQLFHKGDFQDSDDEPQIITRGLADGTIRFEDDDVVKLKVLPVYVTMLYSRGRHLAANGRHEKAIELFKQALALDPRFTVAQQAINESLNAIRKARPN